MGEMLCEPEQPLTDEPVVRTAHEQERSEQNKTADEPRRLESFEQVTMMVHVTIGDDSCAIERESE